MKKIAAAVTIGAFAYGIYRSWPKVRSALKDLGLG
jgi:hypothetical protein